MSETNVICISWGDAFPSIYANRLFAGVRRNISGDLRFIYVTDNRTDLHKDIEIIDLKTDAFQDRLEKARLRAIRKAPMRKCVMRDPNLVPDLNGPLLSLDLDVVITGPLDDLINYEPGKVCIRRVWTKPSKRVGLGNSSVVRYDPKLHGYLYKRIYDDTDAQTQEHYGSEQSYLSYTAESAGDLRYFPDEWIASFKYDCRPPRPLNLLMPPRLPDNARIVCFHGKPKMEEAVEGYRSDPLHSTRPAKWLYDSWLGPK